MARDKEQVSCELLIVRCRLGERAAWEQLVRDWEPKLLYFVRRLVEGEADALDVLQQTWLKVYRRMGTLEDAAALGPWLYRVARNTALNLDAFRQPTVPRLPRSRTTARIRREIKRSRATTQSWSITGWPACRWRSAKS